MGDFSAAINQPRNIEPSPATRVFYQGNSFEKDEPSAVTVELWEMAGGLEEATPHLRTER